ncbi:glycosyltransferase family 2 protein [Schleiferiaceae bacterium]|nr:glycosyltransferase family 2 protein [Schleiferiaceae bacterium]
MNIILPLAGISKFNNQDNFYPPLLREVAGRPLIQHVIENLLTIKGENKFIYVVNEEDCLKFHLDKTLGLLTPNCNVVILKNETSGAVCSILMAMDYVNKYESTIIVNADQIFSVDLNNILDYFRHNNSDAGLISFDSVHPRWSYLQCDEKNIVVQTAEKQPISRLAIAGFYFFKSFTDFTKSAFAAIEMEDFLDGKLYTSTLINQMILMNKKVTNITVEKDDYISFYSNQRVTEFERYLTSKT